MVSMMVAPPSGAVPSRGAVAEVVLMDPGSILGQDLVELLAGLLDHGDAPLDLRYLSGAGKLLCRAHELPHSEAKGPHLVVRFARLLPGERGCPSETRFSSANPRSRSCQWRSVNVARAA